MVSQIVKKIELVLIIICLICLIFILVKLYKFLYCSREGENNSPPCNCLIRRFSRGIFSRGIVDLAANSIV
jgi:hypothetical protein